MGVALVIWFKEELEKPGNALKDNATQPPHRLEMFVNPPQEMCQTKAESLKKVDLGKLRTILLRQLTYISWQPKLGWLKTKIVAE